MPQALFFDLVASVPMQTSPAALLDRYEVFLYKLVVFAVTFVAVFALGRFVVVPVVERVLSSKHVTPTVRQPAIGTVRIAVYFVAFLAGLFFARLESLLTVTGGFAAALTLAFGFASRDILGNLVGGLFIITDPKYNIGDWIEWGNADNTTEGVIEDISFRATRVRTFRNELTIIPNSTLANTIVTNHDIKDRLRIDYPFTVPFDGDLPAMKHIFLDEAAANPRILADPQPTAMLDTVTAAGIDVVVRFWIADPSREKFLEVRSAYFQAVAERFESEGCEMLPEYLELTGDLAVDGAVVAERTNEASDEDPSER
jgi:small-conductance mechanosensitive channel